MVPGQLEEGEEGGGEEVKGMPGRNMCETEELLGAGGLKTLLFTSQKTSAICLP